MIQSATWNRINGGRRRYESRCDPAATLSKRQVLEALRKAGFVDAPRRGKGSHRAMLLKKDPPILVIVPERKDLPTGTLRAIIRQAGLTPEDFLRLL
jgi:predicted RNA binding protein YcfA (HicA-like mRNA interferase family)